MTSHRAILFGQRLAPEGELAGDADDEVYTLYNSVTHKQWVFRIWSLYTSPGFGVRRHHVYAFSAYEGGDIIVPPKDARFKNMHSLWFGQKEWPHCFFETLSALSTFIHTCLL